MRWRLAAILLPTALGLAGIIILVRARVIDFSISLPADLDVIAILAGVGISSFIAIHLAVQEGKERVRQQNMSEARAEATSEHLRFLRRLDHELKNPLMAIRIGLASLVETPDQEEERRIAAGIEDQVQRMSHLVTDLRKLAELETANLEISTIDVADLLEDVMDLLRSRPEAHGRKLVLGLPKLPESLPPYSGDHDLLLLALYNLLDNALKFSRPGDTIKLQAVIHTGTILIQVIDTGRGIAHEEISLVREELYRGQNTEGISGTGVGLALALTIVERHHGEISLQSELGKGTTVTVTLPLR